MQPIYIKTYENPRTEPEDGCVKYYHEDVVAAKDARIQELSRQNTDLQENNTKLVLDDRKRKFGLDVADAERKLTKARITKLQSRIADLEAQLAEARESAVG